MSRHHARKGGRGSWSLATAWALLALAACAVEPAGVEQQPRIAGRYMLTGVTPPESAAGVVTGWLTLGPAAPEPYVFTPAGVAIARSCVHEIPNGAMVDSARVVHMPDGSSYKLPRCGTGNYTLVFTRRELLPDGSSRIVPDSMAGLYTWWLGDTPTTGQGAEAGVTLVDAGLAGPVAFGAAGPVIQLTRQHVGPPLGSTPPDPTYTFAPPRPD